MNAVQRGIEANRVLQEPLLKAAFKGVREKLVESLEQCAIGDTNSQQSLTISLQILKNVQRYLEAAVRDGDYEAMKQQVDADLEARRGLPRLSSER